MDSQPFSLDAALAPAIKREPEETCSFCGRRKSALFQLCLPCEEAMCKILSLFVFEQNQPAQTAPKRG